MIKYLCHVLMMAILLYAAQAEAAIYYVDFDGGTDTNNGLSVQNAWKHAPGDANASGNPRSASLNPGDTVLFKGGVYYRGALSLPASGNDGMPITYKGDGWGQEKAIIDGGTVFGSAWQVCATAGQVRGNPNFSKMYYTDAPANSTFLSAFFEDDQFLWLSQDPNPADPFHYDRLEYLRKIPYQSPTIRQTRTSITDPTFFTQSDPLYWDGAYVVVWRIPNVTTIKKITAYDPATNTVIHEDLGGDIYTDRDTYYAVVNHPALVDQPGEYYFDETARKFYVWPHDSNAASGHQYTVGSGGTGIYDNGKSNVVIEGFKVQKSTFGIRALSNSSQASITNVVIRNNEITHLRSNDWYALQAGGTNILVENNSVTECQRAVGILAGGTNITIKNNYVRNTSRQGIWFMNTTNSAIIGNTVTDILGTHSNPISIYLNCRDILVANNKVHNSNNSGTIQESQNLTFINNFADCNGAFYSWGDMVNVVFVNNVYLQGVYFDSSDQGVVFKNNIVGGGGTGDHTHNIYTWLSWWQYQPGGQYGWTPGLGEVVGPVTNGTYTGVDMSAIFMNAPRFDAELTSFYSTSALHVDDYYGPLVTVGDYVVIDGDTSTARQVVSKSYVYADGGNGRIRIAFAPPVTSMTGTQVSLWRSNVNYVRDYHLKPGSIALDTGTDVAGFLPTATFPNFDFRLDVNGVLRPQGSTWDMGVYEYVQSTVLYGDVSENGTVSAYDASLTAQHAVGSITLTQEQITKAEVSGNGTVSAYDASLIAQKAVGLIDKFPVEP